MKDPIKVAHNMRCKNCGSQKFVHDDFKACKQFIPLEVPNRDKERDYLYNKAEKEKDPKQVKKGKKSKAAGTRFELKVRKDLESKGQTVCKWSNNVKFFPTEKDMEDRVKRTGSLKYGSKEIFEREFSEQYGEMVIAKGKFNPFSKAVMIGQGFPDFIAFKKKVLPKSEIFENERLKEWIDEMNLYEVVGVEVKTNGILRKEEKEKCRWLLDNNKFSKIWIASKGEKRGEIVYVEFK